MPIFAKIQLEPIGTKQTTLLSRIKVMYSRHDMAENCSQRGFI
jgi:hypothetical protein